MPAAAVTSARHAAQQFVDGLAGRGDIERTLAPEARAWAPHLGWAEGEGSIVLLSKLGEELAVGDLSVDAMVAAPHLVVVEAMLVLAPGDRAPVTATLQLDSAARVTEARIYLDPNRLSRG